MQELWRSAKDYEGLYEVSNWGRVRNCRTGRILQPMKNSWGYLQVDLCNDGVHKRCLVHRLVAMAFLSNPDNLAEVNHIDQNKENNCVENLEWCDHAYNTKYSQAKTVYQYSLDGKLCGMWSSTAECDKYGFDHTHIAKCCNGTRKTHKGFKWSYNPPQ